MEFIFGIISQVIFLCQNWNLTNPAVEQHLSEMSKRLSTFRQPPSHYSCGIHGWLRESHLTGAKNKLFIWKMELLISQSSSPATSLPFYTGMQPVSSKDWFQAFSQLLLNIILQVIFQFFITYITHKNCLYWFQELRIHGLYTREVSHSISLPHHCSLPEKPRSLLRQEDLGHSCMAQERTSVPRRLPGRRPLAKGMLVTTELSYPFLLGPHRSSVRLWGQEDMRREARMEILSHGDGWVEYGLIKHCQCRYILELQQIGESLPGPELGPVSMRSGQTIALSHPERPLRFPPTCHMSEIVLFSHAS